MLQSIGSCNVLKTGPDRPVKLVGPLIGAWSSSVQVLGRKGCWTGYEQGGPVVGPLGQWTGLPVLGWFSLFLPQPNTPNPLKGEAFNGLCFGPSDVGQILSFLIKTHMHKGIEPWTFSTRKGTVTIMLLMLAVEKMQIKNKSTWLLSKNLY